MDIDFALAWNFVDATDYDRPRQLRFRHENQPQASGPITGQLIAVIAAASRADHGDTLPISRPDVSYDEIAAALDGWQHWARRSDNTIDLDLIRQRIHNAGLD
ncbi:hypothetical protein A5731_18595 [Mycolicibacterium conceptionense]|uniref:hypothetical protein n=1 Tax=Mycolicibacterium conceptionense TaxID=451644 RepID=UPI0007EBF705|nr:hypothetical protein [Mycolicibacterium conceptionense]OBB05381.1 hypothetical protein A5718_22895 [Mycolicibacterium conceptionense]OBF01284.1 hypothetical protein A5731_18595 [Mycolicibacterium conceptionense]